MRAILLLVVVMLGGCAARASQVPDVLMGPCSYAECQAIHCQGIEDICERYAGGSSCTCIQPDPPPPDALVDVRSDERSPDAGADASDTSSPDASLDANAGP